MDTFMGLGIVLKNEEGLTDELENIVDLLEQYARDIVAFYPKAADALDEVDDEEKVSAQTAQADTNAWTAFPITSDQYELVDKLLYNHSYAEMTGQFGDVSLAIKMTVRNHGEYVVVNFEVDDTLLFGDRSIARLEAVTQKIVSVIDSIDRHISYDYIYCDNEAEYLYSKSRLLEVGYNPYAILKMSDREVVFAAWYVDGFTERSQAVPH